jgi:general secretion pathway protein J
LTNPRQTSAAQADAGFTMFEALVAIALMGLIMGALATVTAQWLPNWTRGLVEAQRNEQVAVALARLAADLAAAEFVSPNRLNNAPLFGGAESAVTFVRSALGPNSRPGLEIVQIAETNDSRGPVLVRTRAPFVLLPTGDLSLDPIPFADPVVLLRAPYRIAFAYAGPDGRWTSNWRNPGALPTLVRFDVRDAERKLVISSGTRIQPDMGAPRPEPVIETDPDAAQAPPNNASEPK